MNAEDLESFLRELGLVVDVITSPNGADFIVIHDVRVTDGPRVGAACDVAIARSTAVPFLVASAIHTRPPLAPMDTVGPLKTQKSELGDNWQYWSRRYDHPVTPKLIWTHVLSVLNEDVS
jgi:Prokaryotic E2 family E